MADISRAKKIALQALEKFLPTGASDAERAALRADPEKYKQYLQTLDTAYGPRQQRAADLGFGDKTYFHGSPSNISEFKTGPAPNKNNEIPFGAHFTENPELASQFADDKKTGQNIGAVYPVKLKKENTLDARPGIYREGTPEFEQFKKIAEQAKLKNYILNSNHEYNGFVGNAIDPTDILNRLDTKSKQGALKGIDSIDYNATYREGPLGSGSPIHDPSSVITKPENIRSTNAAFDPRFEDSADILAINGQAPKSVAGLIVGKALKTPVDMSLGTAFHQINEPLEALNGPRNRAIEIAAKVLGHQLDISGGKVPGMADQNSQILQTVGQMAVPAVQDLVAGPLGHTLGIADKAPGMASKFEGTAGDLIRNARAGNAEQAAYKLEQAMQNGYKPTAAEGLALAKYRGTNTTTTAVIPTAQNVKEDAVKALFEKPVVPQE